MWIRDILPTLFSRCIEHGGKKRDIEDKRKTHGFLEVDWMRTKLGVSDPGNRQAQDLCEYIEAVLRTTVACEAIRLV